MRRRATILTAVLAVLVLTVAAGPAAAELRIGLVDLQEVRDDAPRFKRALEEIDEMIADFEAQRERKQADLESLAEGLQNSSNMGGGSALERKRREMADKSRKFQEFLEEVFGNDGVIENKSSELLAPLYADLAKASSKVAKTMGLDLVLDIEQINPLFSSDNLNVTDAVLEEFLKMR